MMIITRPTKYLAKFWVEDGCSIEINTANGNSEGWTVDYSKGLTFKCPHGKECTFRGPDK